MMGRAELESDTSARTAEDEHIVSLRDVLLVIRRWLWVISVVAVVLAGAAVGFSMAQTPVYEASIKILVGQERGITQDPNYAYGLQQLTQTMVGGVSSRPVAKAVIRQENLQMTTEEFLSYLSAEQEPNTQWILVHYTDSSPERAQRVANAVGDVFSKQVSEVSPNANAITATVWERAVVPDAPVTPNPVRNGLLALVLGLFIGVGLAFLLEYVDDSWNSPEEMERVSGAPTFGIIPEFKGSKTQKEVSAAQSLLKTGLRKAGREAETDELPGRLVTALDPTSAAAEAYRTVRTNLGVVLAQAGKNTLILDCDFRKPVIHRLFSFRNIRGVVDALAGERKLQENWKEPMEGLKVVPVGPVPPNPTELLGTRRFSELLASLREEFDYVLIDAPPVGMVSDPAILATQGDGVLLVSDAQNTRKGSVRQAMRSLEAVGAPVLGTVMNNVETSEAGYYHYRYRGYTYG